MPKKRQNNKKKTKKTKRVNKVDLEKIEVRLAPMSTSFPSRPTPLQKFPFCIENARGGIEMYSIQSCNPYLQALFRQVYNPWSAIHYALSRTPRGCEAFFSRSNGS